MVINPGSPDPHHLTPEQVDAYTIKEFDELLAGPSGEASAHIDDLKNPHVVTLAQIGAETSADTISRFSGFDKPLLDHAARTDNPHSVTTSQLGVHTVAGFDALVNNAFGATSAISAHIRSRSNPHQVEKASVGLGNLMNYPAPELGGAGGFRTDVYVTPKSTQAKNYQAQKDYAKANYDTRYAMPGTATDPAVVYKNYTVKNGKLIVTPGMQVWPPQYVLGVYESASLGTYPVAVPPPPPPMRPSPAGVCPFAGGVSAFADDARVLYVSGVDQAYGGTQVRYTNRRTNTTETLTLPAPDGEGLVIFQTRDVIAGDIVDLRLYKSATLACDVLGLHVKDMQLYDTPAVFDSLSVMKMRNGTYTVTWSRTDWVSPRADASVGATNTWKIVSTAGLPGLISGTDGPAAQARGALTSLEASAGGLEAGVSVTMTITRTKGRLSSSSTGTAVVAAEQADCPVVVGFYARVNGNALSYGYASRGAYRDVTTIFPKTTYTQLVAEDGTTIVVDNDVTFAPRGSTQYALALTAEQLAKFGPGKNIRMRGTMFVDMSPMGSKHTTVYNCDTGAVRVQDEAVKVCPTNISILTASGALATDPVKITGTVSSITLPPGWDWTVLVSSINPVTWTGGDFSNFTVSGGSVSTSGTTSINDGTKTLNDYPGEIGSTVYYTLAIKKTGIPTSSMATAVSEGNWLNCPITTWVKATTTGTGCPTYTGLYAWAQHNSEGGGLEEVYVGWKDRGPLPAPSVVGGYGTEGVCRIILPNGGGIRPGPENSYTTTNSGPREAHFSNFAASLVGRSLVVEYYVKSGRLTQSGILWSESDHCRSEPVVVTSTPP